MIKSKKLLIGTAIIIALILGSVLSLRIFQFNNSVVIKEARLDENFDNEELILDGHVIKPLKLSFSDLYTMPITEVDSPLYCIGRIDPYRNGSRNVVPVLNGTWEGVKLSLILEKAGIRSDAVKVAFYAPDGFSTDLTINNALKDDVIIAYKLNGELLKDRNGNPYLRLVVPGKYGYKWISLLNHIELVDYDFKGTYERQGFSDEATLE